MAIKHRTYRTLANAKTWDGSLLSGGESIRLIDTTGVKSYVLISVSAETPDDLLYFAPTNNPGTKMWTLVTPQGPMSHVRAYQTSAQSIPNSTNTTLLYDVEEQDALGEFVPATGIFTPIYSGNYLLTANVITESVSWAAGDLLYFIAAIDDVNYAFGPRDTSWATFTTRKTASFSAKIPLLNTENLRLKVSQNQGGSVNTSGSQTGVWIAIDRII